MSGAANIFDAAAAEYASQLEQGISLSGESADYFVNGRVVWLAEYLQHQANARPTRVLDFGCGVGNACGRLREKLDAQHVIGLDCSNQSLAIARTRYNSQNYTWTLDGSDIEPQSIDVAYTSGVFHHIEPRDRQAELEKIRGWLKPGGALALFENNPWNPGTRWVMSRIAFDRDARCLSPIETRRRLKSAGFRVESTRSLFYFPRCLAALRPYERYLAGLPLGAQYVVVAKRDG